MPVDLAYEDASAPSPLLDFGAVAVLPEAGDNCCIARTPLLPGTRFALPSGVVVTLAHHLLEGHRIAVERIAKGAHIKSWGLTFGVALRDIEPGEYMANERVLKALRARGMTALPAVILGEKKMAAIATEGTSLSMLIYRYCIL
jgi:hypothetical protein